MQMCPTHLQLNQLLLRSFDSQRRSSQSSSSFCPAHTKIDILSKAEVSCPKSSCFCPSTCRGSLRWFVGLRIPTLKMSNMKREPLHASQHDSGMHQNSQSSSEALDKASGFHSLILQRDKRFIIHGEPRCLFPDPKPGCTSLAGVHTLTTVPPQNKCAN